MVEMIGRRGFLAGIIAAAAAPALVMTPGLIMPIKPKLVAAPIVNIERGGLLLMERTLRSVGGNNDTWPPPQKEYRWVRAAILGEPDVANVADMYSRGWSPVSAAEKPALFAKGVITVNQL